MQTTQQGCQALQLPMFFSTEQRARTFFATARRFPNVYAAARSILIERCPLSVPSLTRFEHQSRLDEFIALSGNLVDFQPKDGLSALFAILLEAQSGFAAQDCFLPCQEDGLTALLKKRIIDAADRVNAEFSEIAMEDGSPVLYIADLNVRGRERRTGGDIAFIIQLDDGYVCHCFQAKRANLPRGEAVSVRRGDDKNHDGGNQLRRLARMSELGIVSSYLFYNNDFKAVTFEPAAPIAKNIGHILLAGEDALDVYLDKDCCDLATYILQWAAGPASQAFVFDDESVVDAIDALVDEDVTHIIAVGADLRRLELLLRLAGERGVSMETPPSLTSDDIDFSAIVHAPNIGAPWESLQ